MQFQVNLSHHKMSYRSRFDDPYPRSRGDERGGRSNDDGRGRPVEDRYRDYPPNSAPRRSGSPGIIFEKLYINSKHDFIFPEVFLC